MKVGMLTTSVSRQAGGMLWAIRLLANGMTELGCNVSVIGGIDSNTFKDRPLWKPLVTKELDMWQPHTFGYIPGLKRTLHNENLDLLHLHGLWTYPSIAASKWAKQSHKKIIVSPHGMLDTWALHNSGWKKKIAGWFYENRSLRKADCLHALSYSEYEAIRKYGLKNPVAIIPNGIELPSSSEALPKPEWEARIPDNHKVLLFLSRLHPKKGLVNLLQAWALVQNQAARKSGKWSLAIGGWEQGEHLSELKRLTRKLGIESSVHFIGPQFSEQKAASLERSDAFILPSFSEGLPISVLTAWSYGLPVMMTPQCNLPEGFDAQAALVMAPNVESISATLAKMFDMSDDNLQAMGENGRALVEQHYTTTAVTSRMHEVYEWLLGFHPKPDSVLTD